MSKFSAAGGMPWKSGSGDSGCCDVPGALWFSVTPRSAAIVEAICDEIWKSAAPYWLWRKSGSMSRPKPPTFPSGRIGSSPYPTSVQY